MAIPREAYEVLVSVVGSEYISEDPVDCEAYRYGPGGYENIGYGRIMPKVPACVVMPQTTDEVQRIVKACNRYKVPYTPYSTGFCGPRSLPHVPDALLIDLKRMTGFEIDDKHMYAVVESGIISSQLQEEALRRGLYTVVGGGGSQVSVLANMIGDGWSPLSYRIGTAHRRILGTEWVLPDGELLRLGSLALQDDPFWGEGIGPDLRGIMRGLIGWRGGLGIVTKLALKLLPFQPERLEPTGITPNTALQLPPKRVKWINFTMPDKDSIIKAMYEMSSAEVGAAATKVPTFWRVIAKAQSREEFWDLWSKENEESIANFHVLRVLLVGYTSEEQLEYEERVMTDIMMELGGEARRTRPTDESWIKNADSAGMWLMTGGYISVIYVWDALDHAKVQGENYANLKRSYTPPLMPDYGDPGWFHPGEMGHMAYTEFLVYYDPDENTNPVDQYYVETAKQDISKRCYSSALGPHQPMYLTGPAYGPNYHIWMLKVKEEFDPNKVCHPPVPLAHDEFVERAEWMKSVKEW
jgi:glycolate oxidase